MSDKNIYFNHSSTTPLDSQVFSAMLPFFMEEFGNPSSHISPLGQRALKAVDTAREHTARLIGSNPGEIIFTSCATESNNLAVKGLAQAYGDRGRHILISEIEHFSVMNSAYSLKSQGFEVELIPVDSTGTIILSALEEKLREDTILVSTALSSTEIGTIEPVKSACQLVKEHNENILFHTDATSSAGWIPVNVGDLGVDALTLSAHNFYGPKGAGALYLKKGVSIVPLLDGGFQELGRRSGTENVPAIVGMGEASRLSLQNMDERNEKLLKLQKRLWSGLESSIDYIHFTGHPVNRLPGHVSFWVEYAEGESILLFLQVKGVIASSGSACASNLRAKDEDELSASHVLTAVGVPSDICSGSITFFLGKDNTIDEVEQVLNMFPPIIERLWDMSPAYSDMQKAK